MKTETYGPLAVVCGIVFLVWAISAVLIHEWIPSPANRGIFGDSFGAVNALFAGLAFAGILFALHLQRNELITQREELVAQREELQLTRSELQRTAVAQEKSQAIFEVQVRLMRSTARLNALTALIKGYTIKESIEPNIARRVKLAETRTGFIDQLERELEAIEGANDVRTPAFDNRAGEGDDDA
jgi:hypothetical protein